MGAIPADFLNEILNNLVSLTPAWLLFIFQIYYGMRSLRKETGKFPFELNAVGEKINEKMTEYENKVKDYFVDIKCQIVDKTSEIYNRFENKVDVFVNDIDGKVTEFTENLNKNVDTLTTRLNEQVNALQSDYTKLKDNVSIENKYMKVMFEVILETVSKDASLIKSGVSNLITEKLNYTIAEIEKTPQILLENINTVEKQMQLTLTLIGKEKFDELLRNIGYERKQ